MQSLRFMVRPSMVLTFLVVVVGGAEHSAQGEQSRCARTAQETEGELSSLLQAGVARKKPCEELVPVTRAPARKTLYPLPGAIQTHELAVWKKKKGSADVTVFVTQQSSSRLLHVYFPLDVGIAQFATSFQVKQHTSGLHGVVVSQYLKDTLLVTLQFDSSIAYLDVSGGAMVPPEMLLEVFIPLPAKGPHRAGEVGTDVWTGCKGIPGVVRIKNTIRKRGGGKYALSPKDSFNESSFVTYLVEANPIFVEEMNGFIFMTLDKSSAIGRINPDLPPSDPKAVTYYPVPMDIGSTPVGMLRGYSPCDEAGGAMEGDALWFSLGGGMHGGTGAFGRITGDGTIVYFKTTGSFLDQAGYLHLAWAPCSGEESFPKLLLLGSSIAYPSPPLRNPDGVASVTFDKTYSTILSANFEFYPIQSSWLHRIVTSDMSIFVNALKGSTLDVTTTAHVTALGTMANEHSDYFGLFGNGANGTLVNYENPSCLTAATSLVA